MCCGIGNIEGSSLAENTYYQENRWRLVDLLSLDYESLAVTDNISYILLYSSLQYPCLLKQQTANQLYTP